LKGTREISDSTELRLGRVNPSHRVARLRRTSAVVAAHPLHLTFLLGIYSSRLTAPLGPLP
jgi:hypothetical protein